MVGRLDGRAKAVRGGAHGREPSDRSGGTVSAIWGIHNDRPELELIDNGFVSVGWDRIGDLRRLGPEREAIKAALAGAYPKAGPRAVAAWAGVLVRFAWEIAPGDLVVYPYKPDRTLNFGRVAGGYRFESDAPTHRHRRTVEWLQTGVPRELFTPGALYELGSALTLFRVRRHAEELARFAGV